MTRKSPRRYAKPGAKSSGKPDAARSPFVRLQKILAEAGVASRRHSETIIQEGRVSVDGQVVTELGTKVDPAKQQILVDGKPIHAERKAYYMVNKPEGFLSTNDDPEGRDRVIDLLPKTKERLYPVGRLDEASQGLMLVTNDGPLANRLLHPRYGVPKVYRVQVAGHPEREALDTLRTGQEFGEGKFHVDNYKLTKSQGDSTFLEIVLKEGHNREIRRLFARIGHKVLKLQRIAFGPLRMGRLEVGEFRHLTSFEVRQLKQVAAGERPVGEVPVELAQPIEMKPAKRPRPPEAPRKSRS
jgi:23S rRNA pseudouridine2605 synthase